MNAANEQDILVSSAALTNVLNQNSALNNLAAALNLTMQQQQQHEQYQKRLGAAAKTPLLKSSTEMAAGKHHAFPCHVNTISSPGQLDSDWKYGHTFMPGFHANHVQEIPTRFDNNSASSYFISNPSNPFNKFKLKQEKSSDLRPAAQEIKQQQQQHQHQPNILLSNIPMINVENVNFYSGLDEHQVQVEALNNPNCSGCYHSGSNHHQHHHHQAAFNSAPSHPAQTNPLDHHISCNQVTAAAAAVAMNLAKLLSGNQNYYATNYEPMQANKAAESSNSKEVKVKQENIKYPVVDKKSILSISLLTSSASSASPCSSVKTIELENDSSQELINKNNEPAALKLDTATRGTQLENDDSKSVQSYCSSSSSSMSCSMHLVVDEASTSLDTVEAAKLIKSELDTDRGIVGSSFNATENSNLNSYSSGGVSQDQWKLHKHLTLHGSDVDTKRDRNVAE